MHTGMLYIVGTPIGNLEDITLRALRILREADVILCEDTRVTKRLLERHHIKDKQLSTYNERATSVSFSKIVAWLEEGKSVALVSDAGTPGISDPGVALVARVREKLPRVKIESVPGPSALTSALSVAGVPTDQFLFLGFLPHKKGRETLFKEIAASKRAVVFYESTHRILKTLESLHKNLTINRTVVLAHELTKMHEDVFMGISGELIERLKGNLKETKGEFVVIVSPQR